VRPRASNPPLLLKANSELNSETVAALQAFRKRNADAQRANATLAAQPTTVDFAHYRSVLKNKAVIDEAEKLVTSFKPVEYDVSAHVKAIEAFEVKAVRVSTGLFDTLVGLTRLECVQVEKAKETEAQIDVELKDLSATLKNIEDARGFEDLTVCGYFL
jgi:F-type H+-transporting ATPase subunit d